VTPACRRNWHSRRSIGGLLIEGSTGIAWTYWNWLA